MSTDGWTDLPGEKDAPGDAPIDKPARDITDEKTEYLSQPAPYGRFKNGKPRKNAPGGKRSAGRAKKNATVRGGKAGYEDGLNGIFQMAAFGLAMVGNNNKTFLADSFAVAEHGPNIASALDMLAAERPEIAAALDRVLAVGPYSALVAAVAPLALQVISNHGLKVPGAMGRDEYVAATTARFQQQANTAETAET